MHNGKGRRWISIAEGVTLEKLRVIIEAQTKQYRQEIDKVQRETKTAMAQVEQQTQGTMKNINAKTGSAMSAMAKSTKMAMKNMGNHTKSAAREIKGNADKMTGAFKSIVRSAVALVGIREIVEFGKSCVELGSNLTEVQNVVDVTFGSMSGSVNSFARNAITQFGLSELSAKKYMGTYGAMAKSIGIAGQAGYDMSAAITGLTGDVASFYNIAQDEAYTKLQSIFTGETESLKELGVVMTQTALDQYALNNGFGKTTAKMTEQERVMLRYQFVMARLGDAQGDFARTSGTWANQVRVLSLRFEQLKSTIGQGLINAFTPIIQVINSVMAKLHVFAEYFRAITAKLFGDQNAMSNAAGSMASANQSAAGLEDSTGQAAKNVKEMKNQLYSFDQINKQNSEDTSADSGSFDFGGIGPGVDQGLDEIPGKAQEIADKVMRAFSEMKGIWDDIWQPFKGAWDKYGQGAVDAAKRALRNIRDLIKDIGRDWLKVWNNGTGERLIGNILKLITMILNIIGDIAEAFKNAWNDNGRGLKLIQSFFDMLNAIFELLMDIGQSFRNVWNNGTGERLIGNILDLLTMVFDIIADIANAFREAWNDNGRGERLIQSIFDAFNAVLELILTIGQTFRDVWNNGTGERLIGNILEILTMIFNIIEDIAISFKNAWNTDGQGEALIQSNYDLLNAIFELILAIGKSFRDAWNSGTGESILGHILGILTNINDFISNITNRFREAWEAGGQGTAIIQGILDIVDILFGRVDNITQGLAAWADTVDFSPLLAAIQELIDVIKLLTDDAGAALEWLFSNVLQPLASWTIEDAVPGVINLFAAALDAVRSVLEALQPLGQWLWDSFLSPLASWTGGVIIRALEVVTNLLKKFSDWCSEHQELIQNIVIIIGSFFAAFKAVEFAGKIKDIIHKVKNFIGIIKGAGGLSSAISGVVSLLGGPVTLGIGAVIAIGVLLWKNWDTVKEKAIAIWGAIKEWFKDTLEKIGNFFSGLWSGITETFSNIGGWFKDKFDAGAKGIKGAFTGIGNFFSDVWDGICNAFGNVAGWFRDKFSAAWEAVKNVFSTGGKIFDGIKDGILSGLKVVINALIGGINKVIKIPFDGINWALKKIKGVDIFGFKPFDWVEEIKTPQIPKLAKGGIVNAPTLAMIGEAGAEAVVPLQNNTAGLNMLANKLSANIGDSRQMAEVIGLLRSMLGYLASGKTVTVTVEGDAAGMFRIVQAEAKKYKNTTGNEAF